MTQETINETNELLKSEDELFIDMMNDELIENDLDYSLVKQNENVLSYYIEGIYKDEKKEKYNSVKKLYEEPPILTIKDNNDNEVKFELTKQFTLDLIESLQEVKKGYLGYKYRTESKKDFSLKNYLDELPSKIQKNPLKYIASLITIMIIIYLLVI